MHLPGQSTGLHLPWVCTSAVFLGLLPQGIPEGGLKLCGFPKEVEQGRALTLVTSCTVG